MFIPGEIHHMRDRRNDIIESVPADQDLTEGDSDDPADLGNAANLIIGETALFFAGRPQPGMRYQQGFFARRQHVPDSSRRSVATIGFLVTVAIAIFARYVSGGAALMLLPIFSFGLWLGTLSLILLSASLFTLAHLKSWSARYEKTYRVLDEEERQTAAFLEELSREVGETAPIFQKPLPLLPAKKTGSGHSTILPAIVLLVSLTSSNCAPITADQASAIAPSPTAITSSPASRHIYIDWSGSCVRPALEEYWRNVKRELPNVIESRRINEVTLWSFAEDGWCPKRLAEISFPVLSIPDRLQRSAGELESFKNFREALRESEDREWESRRKGAEDRYRASVQEALKPLESVKILPDPNYETRGSDIAGLFNPISQSRGDQPSYFIVLTDLADTRHKELPLIPPAASEIFVLVLLLPAQAKDALLTIGEALGGAEQFQLRSRQLRDAASWAVLAPYFAQNLAALFQFEKPTQPRVP